MASHIIRLFLFRKKDPANSFLTPPALKKLISQIHNYLFDNKLQRSHHIISLVSAKHSCKTAFPKLSADLQKKLDKGKVSVLSTQLTSRHLLRSVCQCLDIQEIQQALLKVISLVEWFSFPITTNSQVQFNYSAGFHKQHCFIQLYCLHPYCITQCEQSLIWQMINNCTVSLHQWNTSELPSLIGNVIDYLMGIREWALKENLNQRLYII